MKLQVQLFLFTVMMLVVVACGSDESLPVGGDSSQGSAASSSKNSGSAEFTFSGGVDAQFSGNAIHMVQKVEADNYFLLGLYDYESDTIYTVITIMYFGDFPGPGTYDVFSDSGDTDFKISLMQVHGAKTLIGGPHPGDGIGADGRLDLDMKSKAGDLVIKSDGGTGLSGTLSFKAEGAVIPGGEDLAPFTVNATFQAVAGEASDFPGVLGGPGM